MKTYIINGLFMCQRMSGIQRYAIEIIKRLDGLVSTSKVKIELLVPFAMICTWRPQSIQLTQLNLKNNTFNKHYWLNIILPRYAKKKEGIVVNLCNLGPINNTGIVCIHDIMYKSNPKFFPIKKRIMPLLYYHYMTKNSECIVTVSQFSKKEIANYYKVAESKICVIGNGWEHIESIVEDEKVLEKFGIKRHEYYVAIGNISPHKNVKWIIDEAKYNPDSMFVIIGQNVLGIGSDKLVLSDNNVIFTGYMSDEECKGLLKNAIALLFPSFCEGFGIPPLEMIALNGNAIVSESSCLPEIFGESVSYIDPYKSDYVLSNILISNSDNAKKAVLEKNSWDRASKEWISLLERL